MTLPLSTHTFTYFVDESGSKGSGGDFFVVSAIRIREPDRLNRAVSQLRDKHGWRNKEFKFGDVTKNSLPVYKALVEVLVDSEAEVGAFVVDKEIFDPFRVHSTTWQGHLWVTSALLKGMLTRKEVATVLVDGISTPQHVAYGVELQQKINRTFGVKRIVSAVSLDSCTCDGLQVADLVASSISHQRKKLKAMTLNDYLSLQTPKSTLAAYCARALGLADFSDGRSRHLNIKTVRAEVPDNAAPPLAGP